jgi:hypothetical protein
MNKLSQINRNKIKEKPNYPDFIKNPKTNRIKIKNNWSKMEFYPMSVIKNKLKVSKGKSNFLFIENTGKIEGTGYFAIDKECEINVE